MSEIPEDIKELNEKISKLKPKENDEKFQKKDFSQISIGFHSMIELTSGIIVGASIGYILDEVFDFQFIMLLIGIIFGSFAGILNVYRYMKSIDNKEEE